VAWDKEESVEVSLDVGSDSEVLGPDESEESEVDVNVDVEVSRDGSLEDSSEGLTLGSLGLSVGD